MDRPAVKREAVARPERGGSAGGAAGTWQAGGLDLSAGWEFIRRRAPRGWPAGRGPAGERVDLPHCWNADDDFREGIAYYRGPGAYRRTVNPGVQRPDARCMLETEGFYGIGALWMNGRSVARFDGQYLGLWLDVTDALRYAADNILAVSLTNRCGRRALPGIARPDFLLYGGLTGRARLVWRPLLRFRRGGVAVVTRTVSTSAPTAVVRAELVNASLYPRTARAAWRVRDADGRALAEAAGDTVTLPAGGTVCVETALSCPDAALWSPESPALYTLEGVLLEEGAERDRTGCRIGFREVEFRPRAGCFVNGRRVPLCGCNRHECRPGDGRALPPALHRADAEQIRGMGLNFVRLSHYPQHPAFLDACDALGLLVYAEIASWKSVRGGRWIRLAERQMRGMIERDRNHPGVILWGLGNEGRHRRAFRRLRAVVRALDPDRPTIYAENHWRRARRRGTLGIPDVWGLNYEFDALERGCEASRLRNVIVSECCNIPYAERGNAEAEADQVRAIEAMLARIRGKDWVAGFALWSFNDYGTLRKRRYRRFCGLVDAWRRPKDAARRLPELLSKWKTEERAGE
jgi:beta-galactosidase